MMLLEQEILATVKEQSYIPKSGVWLGEQLPSVVFLLFCCSCPGRGCDRAGRGEFGRCCLRSVGELLQYNLQTMHTDATVCRWWSECMVVDRVPIK